MKRIFILIFIMLSMFIMPTFASPTGGGDFLTEYSIPDFVDADISVMGSLAELPHMDTNIITFESFMSNLDKPTIRMLSRISAIETNIKLKAVEELMLSKTTINELSGNLIRYVRLSA